MYTHKKSYCFYQMWINNLFEVNTRFFDTLNICQNFHYHNGKINFSCGNFNFGNKLYNYNSYTFLGMITEKSNIIAEKSFMIMEKSNTITENLPKISGNFCEKFYLNKYHILKNNLHQI